LVTVTSRPAISTFVDFVGIAYVASQAILTLSENGTRAVSG
jgi:hypothetical protein